MNTKLIHLLLSAIFIFGNAYYAFGQDTESSKLQPDSAIVIYQKILKKNKKSSFATYGLASAYFAKKDYAAAIKFSKQNIKNPNDYKAASYVIYAAAVDRRGLVKEAIDIFEKALKEFSNDYALWQELAFSCYKYRSFDKARRAVEKAIELNPLNAENYYLYGCILFEGYNEQSCIHTFLYGLILEPFKDRAKYALAFCDTYHEKKHESINIPFFEARYALTMPSDILYEYFISKGGQKIGDTSQILRLIHSLPKFLNTYIPSETIVVANFYSELSRQGLVEVYIYYCMRYANNSDVEIWMRNNQTQLKALASFFENNLKEGNVQ